MNDKRIISSKDFLTELKEAKGRIHTNLTVERDVRIAGGDLGLDEVHLGEITFLGQVWISDLSKHITIQESHLAGGLHIERSKGSYLAVQNCKLRNANFWSCMFERVAIMRCQVDGVIDISGFTISQRLRFEENTYASFELLDRGNSNTASVASLMTDDPVTCFQFRLAGIPVYVSCKTAREMMESRMPVELAQIC